MTTFLPQTQKTLDIKIKTPLGENKLIVDQVTIDEGISMPYTIDVSAHAFDPDIAFKKILGKEATVSVDYGKGVRHFHGLIACAELDGTSFKKERLSMYRLVLHPHLWFLTLTRNYRIFQGKSALDIILAILREHKINKIKQVIHKCGKRVRDYCVQYDESDFDFIGRLLEEEGLFYYFEHTKDKHTLVLADNHGGAKSVGTFPFMQVMLPEPDLNDIYSLKLKGNIISKDIISKDFDAKKPKNELNVKVKNKGVSYGAYYEYPGGYKEPKEGSAIVDRWLEEQLWQSQNIEGECTIVELKPGYPFKIKDHMRKELNTDFRVHKVRHEYTQFAHDHTGEVYKAYFHAFPNQYTFRAPRMTPRPRILSNQTAIVTGPSNQEVYCDAQGRIKVQFHWDKMSKPDEKSSSWIRVAQNWAGNGWGGLVIPRVGMEVVVSFINGNPDQPLVTGCVYNGANLPPDYVKNANTKSTFKTRSSPKAKGFNELRFEDKKDAEEIYMHAQKDWKTVIQNERTTVIKKSNDTLTLEKGNRTIILKKGNHLLELKNGHQTMTLKKGNMSIKLSNGNVNIKVKGSVKIDASKDMTLSTNGNFNVKAKRNIKMQGMNVNITGKMNAKLEGKMKADVKGGAMATVKAGLVFLG